MQAPARRVFLVQATALALGGCGFQLRGAPELAFASLFINVADTSSLGNELKRNLGSLGTQTGDSYQSMLAQLRAQSAARASAPLTKTVGW